MLRKVVFYHYIANYFMVYCELVTLYYDIIYTLLSKICMNICCDIPIKFYPKHIFGELKKVETRV